MGGRWRRYQKQLEEEEKKRYEGYGWLFIIVFVLAIIGLQKKGNEDKEKAEQQKNQGVDAGSPR